jgi:hypothetical protein
MGTLAEQLIKARAVSSDSLIKSIFQFIRSIESELADLNREQLFKESTDIFGQALGFYSKATEFITTNDALLGKNVRIKRAGEPFDMKQEDIFLPSIFARVSNQVIIFGATDPKTDLILSNENLLTKSLFGLKDENLIKVIQEKILPFYLQYSRAQIGI